SDKLQISEGYAAIYGLPEGTTQTTMSEWRARVHAEDLGRLEGVRDQAFADRRKEYTVEFRIVLASSVRWIERRSSILYSEDGRREGVGGVSIDTTERKLAEEARKILNAELDHRVKNALATVSAVVPHTRRGRKSVTDFAAALEGRIRSLATTH